VLTVLERIRIVPRVREHGDVLVAAIILGAIVVVLLVATLPETGGEMVYAFDDAYIHLAIAKNLVRHGVWGVTRYAFSSSSSSLACRSIP